MDSWKFSTSGFWWIYMFWDVLNTIWPFLENVCLSVCLRNFRDTISSTNEWKWIKLYIQLYLDKNWCWLDISRYLPIGGADMIHFPRIFWYLNYLISLGLLHGNKRNSDERILIKQKKFRKIFVPIEHPGALLLYSFLEFSGIFDFI